MAAQSSTVLTFTHGRDDVELGAETLAATTASTFQPSFLATRVAHAASLSHSHATSCYHRACLVDSSASPQSSLPGTPSQTQQSASFSLFPIRTLSPAQFTAPAGAGVAHTYLVSHLLCRDIKPSLQ